MKEIKPIYYSRKMNKYYFNNTTAFGAYYAETVYNGDALKGGEIKTDKNGKQYILGFVEKVRSQNGRDYYKCTGFYIKPTDPISDLTVTNEQESAF